MFIKFFRALVTLILTVAASQASAQGCNVVSSGNGQVYQECFAQGNWTPVGYNNGGSYNLLPGVPAIFPRTAQVNIPAGYRREECDPGLYVRNMTQKVVSRAAVGAVIGLLAGDSREAAGKGAAAGALVGVAESLQCFVLVKDEVLVAKPQQVPSSTGAVKIVQVSGGTPLVNCDYEFTENGKLVTKRVHFYRHAGQTEWIPHTFDTCKATPYEKYEKAVGVMQ